MDALVITALVIAIFAVIPIQILLRRRRIVSREMPCAIEIARRNGWVSLRRLMSEGQLTRRNAQFVLNESCRQGFLYQGLGDAYYVRAQTETRAQNDKSTRTSVAPADFGAIART